MSSRASVATGYTDPAFSTVRSDFDAMLRADPGFSAQLVVVHRGRTVIDLAGGPTLAADSISAVFSASKGVAAAVIGMLIDDGALDVRHTVASYWPEFADRGKADITVAQVLSHRAGVIGVPERFSAQSLIDSREAAAQLAAAAPAWEPGAAHGYHAITIGVVMEELVRRVTGQSLQSVYEARVRRPLGIDFYLGVPASEEQRYVPVYAPDAPPTSAADGIQALAFNACESIESPLTGPVGPNSPAIRAAGVAAIGGVGSARGLAAVYSGILGGESVPLLSEGTRELMSREHSFGQDRVLGFTTSFGLGFMKPHPAMDFGSYQAFGHDGAGGALAFADPLHGVAFGYVPSPMQPPGGADPKAITLSQLVRDCVRSAGG